jgi:hypothetical protein
MLKLLSQPLWKILIGVFAVILFAGGVSRMFGGGVVTQNCVGITMVVNDSTQAICTKLKADRTELLGLRAAAAQMDGTVVAGTKIIIKTDTLWLPPTETPTDTFPDRSRVATLSDTTADYTVTFTAEAPPFPANLRLGYQVVTPERTAEVGFVKADGGYYAVVTGRGITATQSFFNPTPEREFPLGLYAGGGVSGNPVSLAPSVRGNAFLSLQYRHGLWTSALEAGVDDRFYTGLRIQRRIF